MPDSATAGLRRPSRFGAKPARAVVLLAVLTIAAIATSVAALLWQLRQRDLDHARHETRTAALMVMDQTAQALDGPQQTLQALKERLETPFGRSLPLDGPEVHLLLAARAHGVRPLRSVFVLDAEGRTMSTAQLYPALRITAADRDYFRAFAQEGRQGLFVGKAVRGKSGNDWTMHMSVRVDDADGRLRAVLVAALDLSYFEHMFDHLTIDYVRPIGLYMADGTLVASLPHREADLGQPAQELRGLALPQGLGQVLAVARARGEGGAPQRMAVGRLEGYPMLASVSDDDVETLATWRETAVTIALSAVVVALFVGGAAAALVAQLHRDERLQRALADADQRFRQTLETVMDAIVSVDERQNIVIFNQAAERMFGHRAEDVIGLPLSELLPEGAREGHHRQVGAFMAQGGNARTMSPQAEIRGRRSDGSEFPIESTISKTLIRGRLQMTAVLRDITERRRTETELQRLTDELRRLSVALQSVREEERSRISRELHDELGQQLTGIKLDLSWLMLRLKDGRSVEPAKLESMREQLDGAIVTVRQISSELRPRVLDELGFGEAVAWQAAEFTRRTGVPVALDLRAASLVKRPELATALFRIVQESLTNVARHAGARQVHLELTNDDCRLYLRVRDDGVGIRAGEHAGVGLLSMRERANALGGHFSAEPAPGGGTQVEVVVQLEASPVAEEAAA